MQFNYYHEAVSAVAGILEESIDDYDDAHFDTLDDIANEVRGWMTSEQEIAALLRLVNATRAVIGSIV